MCCRHRDRDTCGMWNTSTWFSSTWVACFHMQWPGVSSDTCCTCRYKPHRGCCGWQTGNVWGSVLPHTAKKEVRLLGWGCPVVADELQAEFIYEHVEGAKVVAGTRAGSLRIHDYVGNIHGPNEELHEETARPGVMVSCSCSWFPCT